MHRARPTLLSMGLGGMPGRLDPRFLDMDQSLRDRLSRYAVERRDPTGHWVRIGLFGSARDAADNIDVLVAMHGGELSEYRFTRVGLKTWIAVVGWVALALMVAATVTGLIVLWID
jgi:hypothetical protein